MSIFQRAKARLSLSILRLSPSTATLQCTCNATSPMSLFQSAPFSTSTATQLSRKPTRTKLKTHKGAAKRWIALSNGAFKRSKTGRVHLNSAMSPERLNRLGQAAYARPGSERKLLRRLLPYSQ
ncbi:hypothetical protein ACM66B_003297 [Microbotryomycetes sp. NB124-2]